MLSGSASYTFRMSINCLLCIPQCSRVFQDPQPQQWWEGVLGLGTNGYWQSHGDRSGKRGGCWWCQSWAMGCVRKRRAWEAHSAWDSGCKGRSGPLAYWVLISYCGYKIPFHLIAACIQRSINRYVSICKTWFAVIVLWHTHARMHATPPLPSPSLFSYSLQLLYLKIALNRFYWVKWNS